MEKSKELELVKSLQRACEFNLKDDFAAYRLLYFDDVPLSTFCKEYKVELIEEEFNWAGEAKLSYQIYEGEDYNYGKQVCRFEQECTVSYKFKLNSLAESASLLKTIQFHVETFEPFGCTARIMLLIKELSALEELRKLRSEIKQRYQIENIAELRYENDSTCFGFFANTLRKPRRIKPEKSEISHGFFCKEMEYCHEEIQECLLTALFHQKNLSDLLGKKISSEYGIRHLPNLGYSDMQYLLMIGFGFDRLYSFWERITFLLSNYQLTKISPLRLSFSNYIKEIKEKILKGKQITFDPKSPHLNWVLNFYNTNYSDIIKYRHKSVHFQMSETNDWQGVLTSKFSNNTSACISNEVELQKLKLEFEGLGNLLLEHFNFCKKGFIEALKLIDELE